MCTMLNYSFIIPHKNSTEYLSRCLKSIPEREDVEIIVVDDNSDEDKKPVIEHPNERIVYLNAKESNGAGKARNEGLSRASGKWLLFADCDDFYERNFLVKLDEFVDSSYDVIFFDSHFFYEPTDGDEQDSPRKKYIDAFLDNPESLKSYAFVTHCDENVWSRMFRRDFINEISAQFEERLACNDGWFAHYTSIKANAVKVIDSKLYYYVKNAGSISQKKQTEKMYLDRFMAACRIRKLLYHSNCRIALAKKFSMRSFLGRLRHQGLRFFLRLLYLHFRYDVPFGVIYYFKIKTFFSR